MRKLLMLVVAAVVLSAGAGCIPFGSNDPGPAQTPIGYKDGDEFRPNPQEGLNQHR